MTTDVPDLDVALWRVRNDVAVVEIDRSVVVLALGSADPVPLSLEGTATTIWRTIDGRSDANQIAARVAADYAADFDVVLPEVMRFLDRLERVGLIERCF